MEKLFELISRMRQIEYEIDSQLRLSFRIA